MKTRERRDELGKATIGDTGKPRKRPHRGNDWGDRAGSAGKDFYAVHAGKVVKVLKTSIPERVSWVRILPLPPLQAVASAEPTSERD